MKHILKYSASFVLLLVLSLTSCLKDKGIDNGTYGITGISGQLITLSQANRSITNIAVDYITTAQTFNFVDVTFESDQNTPDEIKITLAEDPTAVTAWNANPDRPYDLTVLPVGSYELVGTVVTIPSGGRVGKLQLRIINAQLLSTSLTYGLGVKIVSNDKSIPIATNQKVALFGISAKNQYDGVYRLRGFHNRTTPNLSDPYDEEVHMITSGPNSVYMYWPAAGLNAHPLHGGTTYYGSFTSNFIFDPATQLLTSWNWTPYATTLPTAVGPATDSRFDPATRTIYAQFYYNNNPTGRGFTDTLTYLGPR